MIEVRNVTYRVEGRALVDGVDLEVQPGEVLALVGANGAGKSTLLKILSGELAPSSGRVTLDGRPLREYGAQGLARRRAVLPQHTNAAGALTVGEALALGRLPHPPSTQDHVGPVLDATNLASWKKRTLGTLSGGESQRVHFARGLVQLSGVTGSRFYFLDEPTSALDVAYQIDALRRVSALADEGYGVVLVVHDLNLAARFAHRLAVLRQGRLVACGRPEEVLREDLLLEAFSTRAAVVPHPVLGHPLVLPLEAALA